MTLSFGVFVDGKLAILASQVAAYETIEKKMGEGLQQLQISN
jgi:hypothetical protein